jgi:Serine carboxypeptidase S28
MKYARWRGKVVDCLLVFILLNEIDSKVATGRRKPRQNVRSYAPLQQQHLNSSRFSILNMTCDFFVQPLNHFALPKDSSPTYRQRFCVYNEFATDSNSPVFFYAGNESPLEQYINNTGLMWELGAQFGAQIVFAEHRYEGESLPPPNITNCMAVRPYQDTGCTFTILTLLFA